MQYTCTYESPLGEMLLLSDGEAIQGAWFIGQKHFGSCLEPNHINALIPALEMAKEWLNTYFHCEVPSFSLNCRFIGTPFQIDVWREIAKIPYGSTLTYGDIAKAVTGGEGGAVMARAVGSAVGRNPISVIVPCHRVISADGSLSGYAGGTERKKALLELEKRYY